MRRPARHNRTRNCSCHHFLIAGWVRNVYRCRRLSVLGRNGAAHQIVTFPQSCGVGRNKGETLMASITTVGLIKSSALFAAADCPFSPLSPFCFAAPRGVTGSLSSPRTKSRSGTRSMTTGLRMVAGRPTSKRCRAPAFSSRMTCLRPMRGLFFRQICNGVDARRSKYFISRF